MRRRSLLSTLIVLAFWTSLDSTPVRSLDVAGLTAGAELIVVGQVSAVVPRERTTLDLSSGSVPATRFSASLRIDRVLKGDLSFQNVTFYFLLPDAPIGFHGVAVGQYGVLFLKTTQNRWEFVDPTHPALPAIPNAQLRPGTPLDQVTALLGEVLTSSQTSDSDHTLALDGLGQLGTDLAREVLREALKTTSGDLRLTIAGRLIAHNDLTGLESVATALMNPSGLSPNLLLNLAGSLGGLKDPKAIPTLARLVKANNPDINRYAAAALRQSGSWEALEPLSHLFDDPDLWTRYYAVIGFGEITHQYDWAPAFDEFRGNEKHYLGYWHAWAQTNLH